MKTKLLSLFLVLCLMLTAVAGCTTDAEPEAGSDEPESSVTETVETGTAETVETAVETTTTEPAVTTTEPETAAEEPSTRIYTDSLGRDVEVPAEITRIALSGPLTQIVLFALCPDRLVGLSNAWDDSAEEFLDEKYYNLPMLGQLYGGKGTLNLETIAAAGAQIIIDVGEVKDNMAQDMDNLQAQLGIPTIHIDAYTAGMGDAYRELGKLLDMEEEAAALGEYCDAVYQNTLDLIGRGGEDGKVRLLYCLGDAGINVIARGPIMPRLSTCSPTTSPWSRTRPAKAPGTRWTWSRYALEPGCHSLCAGQHLRHVGANGTGRTSPLSGTATTTRSPTAL
jgi:iron complex transport system substrate-binding protein